MTIGASFGIDGTDGHGEMTLATAQMTDTDPFGVPPTNLDAIFQTILQRTCDGTPVQPTMDLLLPHPPEAKVDPYASIRDTDGRVQLPK